MKRFMQKILTTLFAVLFLQCMAVAQTDSLDIVEYYHDVELCEDTCRHIHGIDISHYQGKVFWQALGQNHRTTYVYLKATEGGNRIDQLYADNIFYAHQQDMLVGSYHFFRPQVPVAVQLKNFTTQCRPADQDLLPLIDVEMLGKLSVEAFRDSLSRFLLLVENYYHAKPLVYSGRNFYNKYLQHALDDYPLMIAMYNTDDPPLLDDGHPIVIWQYTGKGTIEGINGYVDKSRFLGHHRLREILYSPTAKANSQR